MLSHMTTAARRASQYASYSVSSFRRRFGLFDGVAYPFLDQRRLFRTDRTLSLADGTQGSDFYESAIPHADVFLADLAAALVPSALPHHARRYLRNVALGETATILNASACADPFAVCRGEVAPPTPPAAANFCRDGTCLITAPPSPDRPPPAVPPLPTVAAARAPPSETVSASGGPIVAVLVVGFAAALGGLLIRSRRGRASQARLMDDQAGGCPPQRTQPDPYAAPAIQAVMPAGVAV